MSKVPDEELKHYGCKVADQEVDKQLRTQHLSTSVSMAKVLPDVSNYYRQTLTIIGSVKASTYYNYGYGGAKETHFSFEVSDPIDGKWSLYAFGEKEKFRTLFDESTDGRIVKAEVTTDERHGSETVWTLVSWSETGPGWKRDPRNCCAKNR